MRFCKGHKECQCILKNGALAFFVAFFIGLDHKPPKWFVSHSGISKFSGAMWVKGGCRFTEEFSDQWNMATWLDVSWCLKPRDWWTWFEISSFDDPWTSLSTTYYNNGANTSTGVKHSQPWAMWHQEFWPHSNGGFPEKYQKKTPQKFNSSSPFKGFLFRKIPTGSSNSSSFSKYHFSGSSFVNLLGL